MPGLAAGEPEPPLGGPPQSRLGRSQGQSCLLVEVVVEADSQAGALAAGAAVIDTAFRAGGEEQQAAIHGSTARTEDLIRVNTLAGDVGGVSRG